MNIGTIATAVPILFSAIAVIAEKEIIAIYFLLAATLNCLIDIKNHLQEER